MMRQASLVAIAIAMASPAPAFAQTRDKEVEELRAKVTADEATIARLEARLEAIEARVAAASPSPAAAAAVDAGASAGKSDAKGAAGQAVDLADLDQKSPASGPSGARVGDTTWTLAPPGPIEEPLRPAPGGKSAAFELLAGTGGGRASFTLSSSRDTGGESDGIATPVYNSTMSLSLSAPLSKGDDTTTIATLDGLSSGSKVEFSFTRFKGRVLSRAEDSRDALLIRARDRCNRENPPYKPGCVRLDDDFKKHFFTPDELDAYERGYARRTIQQSLAWSLRAGLGYDEFTYFPLPGLAEATDKKVSWNVGGSLVFFPIDRSSFSLNLDYQQSYKAGKAKTTCPVPTVGAISVTCVPGPLLGPELKKKLIAAAEGRYFVPISEDGLIRGLGFAPRVEYDALSDSVALDMPVYLATDDKGGLVGGVRFGYTTDDKDFVFGVFVGKTFSLFQ